MGGAEIWSAELQTLVATQSDHPEVIVWDATHGKMLRTLEGHEGHLVFTCQFAPGTKQVATASYADIRTYDTDTGEQLDHQSLRDVTTFNIPELSFDSEGKLLLVANRRLFRCQDGKLDVIQDRKFDTLFDKIPQGFQFGGNSIPLHTNEYSSLGRINSSLSIADLGVKDGQIVPGKKVVVAQPSQQRHRGRIFFGRGQCALSG